jgi:hypothetical protein
VFFFFCFLQTQIAVTDEDLIVLPAKRIKPAPEMVATAPEAPKMIRTKQIKTPNITGKSVKFALEKNTTHTFKKEQTNKRRFSLF